MTFKDWWRHIRGKESRQPITFYQPPEPVEPPAEEVVAAATIFEVLAADDEMQLTDVMYRNAIWGREDVTAMLNVFREHVAQDHADPMDCDVWCLPDSISNHLDSMNRNQLIILFLVTFKGYFVLNSKLPHYGSED